MSSAADGSTAPSPLARAWRYFIEKPSEREARRSAAGRAAEVQQRRLTPVALEQRRAALDNAIMTAIAGGAVMEHRRELDAVLRYDAKVNHVLHAILSILTMGAWLFVWLILAFYAKPVRVLLSVDEYGLVARSTVVA